MSDRKPIEHHLVTRYAPLVFLAICLTLVFGLWRTAQRRDTQRLQAETTIAAEQIKMRLEAWIDARTAAVTIIARNFRNDPTRERTLFHERAQAFIESYPGFQALNFIDPGYVIRIVHPERDNVSALDKDLHFHPEESVLEAVRTAEETSRLTGTPMIRLLQGKPGIATYCPMSGPDGALLGFVNGVFSLEKLVDGCLSEDFLYQRFRVGVFTQDGEPAFLSPGSPPDGWPDGLTSVLPLRIVDKSWRLRLAPGPTILEKKPGPNEFLSAGGLILSLMLAFLLRAYLGRMAELRQSREGYRLLVDNVADMVVRVDLSGRIVFANPSCLEFLGLDGGGLMGSSLADHCHEDDRTTILEARRRIFAGESREEAFIVRLRTPSGNKWTSWSGSAFIDARGQVTGIVGVGRDIDEQRTLEDQLRRSQKLQAVGQLAGGIAHDFNNIIQAIQGYIDFVMQDLPPGSDSREDLQQANLAAERAAKLTRQLLAFSSRQVIDTRAVDLHRIIADMRPMLTSLIGEGIALEFDLRAGSPTVSGDQGQLEQVLLNLCLNARDAIPGNGRIRIATADAAPPAQGDGSPGGDGTPGLVRLTIADDGAGMSPEVLAKIFDPFFTTKVPGKGTGLGLATVYGIIKQHDGVIRVESEPGRGTTFSIDLRQATGEVEDEIHQASSRFPGSGETILVVEDEQQIRDLTRRTLTRAGYRVLTAGDGIEACEVLDTHQGPLDLALIDVVLPRLDGRGVHARLKKDRPATPVVFMSGYDPASEQKRKDLPGPLLPKPFKQEDLLAVVAKGLRGG
ncbi:MAG: ATP-binding protein [Candidatus Krumholzibacteriia bacterium]